MINSNKNTIKIKNEYTVTSTIIKYKNKGKRSKINKVNLINREQRDTENLKKKMAE